MAATRVPLVYACQSSLHKRSGNIVIRSSLSMSAALNSSMQLLTSDVSRMRKHPVTDGAKSRPRDCRHLIQFVFPQNKVATTYFVIARYTVLSRFLALTTPSSFAR